MNAYVNPPPSPARLVSDGRQPGSAPDAPGPRRFDVVTTEHLYAFDGAPDTRWPKDNKEG